MSMLQDIFESLYPEEVFKKHEAKETKEYKKARKISKAVSKSQKELYTQEELEVLRVLVKAHDLYGELPKEDSVHGATDHWRDLMRGLEGIIALRGLRRKFPEHTHRTTEFYGQEK